VTTAPLGEVAEEIVEREVRELVHRRDVTLDDATDLHQLLDEVVADYRDRFLGGGLPALTDEHVQVISEALSGGGVACSDLIFVGGDGCQDLALFRLRDLEEVRGPSGLTSNARLCGSRWQNELSNRFCETFILVTVGHRARLRFYFVAGVAHCDGKSALAEHKDVIWHISDRCDLRGRNAQKL